ncbi:MAG: iron ABC transporter permease [Chloroflexi bacterium]|nr:iron ABC transporter permease [Chloroflexota bacterium]
MNKRWPQLVYVVPLLFLALFFFYPLYSIFALSLAPEGALDLQPLRVLITQPYYARVLWFTTWQATLSTLLTLLLGLPAAFVFARYEFRGKALLRALTSIPFVLPTMVVATAFTSLLGPRGRLNAWLMAAFNLSTPLIDIQHTLGLILLAHVFYNVTIVVRIVGGFWANLDPRQTEAARVLGAGRWPVFREITLPLLRPAIVAAALLVYLFCFTSFGVILVLGGPRFATLEVEIYRQAVHLFHLPLAAALAIVQVIFTFVIMVVYTRLQARQAVPIEFRPRRATQRRPTLWRDRLLVAVCLGGMLLLLLAPLAALAERSFSLGGRYDLHYYRELFTNRTQSIFFVPPAEAIRNSLLFGAATVALSLIVGAISAYLLAPSQRKGRALLDPLFMLPLGTSAVTLGFGYIIALDEPPLNLRTSPVLVVLAHTLVAFPFVVRTLLPVLRGMNPNLREAAAVMGASPLRVAREVDLPLLFRALLVGAVFAFTVSMGEFGATVLIARPEFPTMPVAIFRFLGQPGLLNYGQALAMSTLLMAVCAAGFLLIERFRIGEVGEF